MKQQPALEEAEENWENEEWTGFGATEDHEADLTADENRGGDDELVVDEPTFDGEHQGFHTVNHICLRPIPSLYTTS